MYRSNLCMLKMKKYASYQNFYLSTRIAIRFFIYAFINFTAFKATVEIAANALYSNWRDIHLKSSSIARSASVSCSRSSKPSRVRSSSHRVSSGFAVRAFFSITSLSESHRVFIVTYLPKVTMNLFSCCCAV